MNISCHRCLLQIASIIILSGVSILLALFLFMPHVSSAYVSNDAWDYRIKISIDHNKVKGNVTNFPVYIDLATLPPSFFKNVKKDGGDIRVFSSNGTTELPLEVVSINPQAKTGELYFLAPVLSSKVDTKFYLYYGNSNAIQYSPTDTFGRNAVWLDYARVYHGSTIDSTGNVDGVLRGTVSESVDVTHLGTTALTFTNNDTGSDFSVGELTGRTVQGWVRDTDSEDFYCGYFVDVRTNVNDGWVYLNHPYGYPQLSYGSAFTGYLNGKPTSGSGNATTTFNSWNFITVRSGSVWTDDSVHFGNRYGDRFYNDAFVGQMDELRITKTLDLPTAWIKTEYNNQSSPASFYKVGIQKFGKNKLSNREDRDGSEFLNDHSESWKDVN
jgi:hypothetical protein